jgi:excisionase family DNA binding protein
MSPNTEPLALSPAAAGRFLGVSKRQIYVLLAAGSIRARKLGRATLIDASSLKEFYATLPAHESGNPLFSK